ELGETVLGGRCVGGHVESSFQLPATEMCATIDVQDVTRDRRRVGQVHDCVRDVLDYRRPTHRRQVLHHVLWRVLVQRRIDGAGRSRGMSFSASPTARCGVIFYSPPLVIIAPAAGPPGMGLGARAAVIVTMLPPVFRTNICLMAS